MRTTMRILLVFLFCLTLAAPVRDSETQARFVPGSLPVAQTSSAPASGGEAGSFAGAFFLSRKTDPLTGEKSLEILGSLIIWFLLCLSMLSIGLIGHMALTNQRKSILPEGMVEEARRLLEGSNHRELLQLTDQDESFFSRILHAGLSESPHGFSAVIRSLEQTSDELTTDRLRKVEYLNVLGQVSPMIGLFGTVYGMILAFHAIVMAGGSANPVLLAGGIGTALTTTFWGLVVAIPALAGYAIVRNKIDALTTEATLVAEELLNKFRPKGKKRGTDTK
ncbi:MAG: MotA/TolQ/ExbB proton channel family protein [Phycisphaerales bacterium]|nr:MAG: MotA/TolQ/ExbB proton channel family protein [Phycisphaerales bacterium]